VVLLGYWLGYLPQYDWSHYYNYGFTEVEAGGEVASASATPRTDMGSGILPGTSGTAMFNNVQYSQSSPSASYYMNGASTLQEGPSSAYNIIDYGNGNATFGGPGFC
jgi:hypothetical protein